MGQVVWCRSETRTRTLSPVLDFESSASTVPPSRLRFGPRHRQQGVAAGAEVYANGRRRRVGRRTPTRCRPLRRTRRTVPGTGCRGRPNALRSPSLRIHCFHPEAPCARPATRAEAPAARPPSPRRLRGRWLLPGPNLRHLPAAASCPARVSAACRAAASCPTRISATRRPSCSSSYVSKSCPVTGSHNRNAPPRSTRASSPSTSLRRTRRPPPGPAAGCPDSRPRPAASPAAAVRTAHPSGQEPVLLHPQRRVQLPFLVPVHRPRAPRHHLQHEVRTLRFLPQLVAPARILRPLRRPHHHEHVRRTTAPGLPSS